MPEINQNKSLNNSKFSTIFMVSAFMLMLLPFISTFNHFLTRLLLEWNLYRVLQDVVVPYQAKVLSAIFSLFYISSRASDTGLWVGGSFLTIEWNCLGWQSGVLLIATFLTGFQGKFSKMSRFETIIIGMLGTYFINLFRISFVGFLAIYLGRLWAGLFHDYFSLILVVLWFFFFWWFSYTYVLEEKIKRYVLDKKA